MRLLETEVDLFILSHTWDDSIDRESDIENRDKKLVRQRVQHATKMGRLSLEVSSNETIHLK